MVYSVIISNVFYCTIMCLSVMLMDLWHVFGFGLSGTQHCFEHSCTSMFMDTCFHFIWGKNTQNWDQYLIVVYICIPMIISYDEHSFMAYLLAIPLPSLVKHLFKSFALFYGMFVFLLLSYRNALYILDTGLLSDR